MIKLVLDQKLLSEWIQARKDRKPCLVDLTSLDVDRLIHVAGYCIGIAGDLELDRFPDLPEPLEGELYGESVEEEHDYELLQSAKNAAYELAMTAAPIFIDAESEILGEVVIEGRPDDCSDT